MIDRDSPVTDDELHAFIDGELAEDRQDAVAAWLTAHLDDAALIAAWRAQAEAIRARYGAVAAEPVPKHLQLDELVRKQRSWAGLAAAAALAAFLVGGFAGWMAHGASAAAPPTSFDIFTAEALDAYKLYVVEVRHPVEVPATERAHMVQWLSKRVGYELRVPDLEPIGLKLIGGRLLPRPTGAAAFYMYEGASGERFTIYCARSVSPETALRYKGEERFAAFYWAEHDVAYVVSGPADRERLQKITEKIYEQVEQAASAKDKS